jgi:aryl-alcohol dehydrogenase-like predicted oxidoreductase
MEINYKPEQRPLGSQGLVVSCQGLGCMGMTGFYDASGISEEEKINLIGKALELGINFLDTAWIYQNFITGEKNEELVGKAL